MEYQYNASTMIISAKVTASEKMRYEQIAKSYNITFSEWMASILSIYQNAHGELKRFCRICQILASLTSKPKTIENQMFSILFISKYCQILAVFRQMRQNRATGKAKILEKFEYFN